MESHASVLSQQYHLTCKEKEKSGKKKETLERKNWLVLQTMQRKHLSVDLTSLVNCSNLLTKRRYSKNEEVVKNERSLCRVSQLQNVIT